MPHQDPPSSLPLGIDAGTAIGVTGTSDAPHGHWANPDLSPIAQGAVRERLANLSPLQLASVRAIFGEEDVDKIDPDEVIDLCDRVSERITFAQYQARRRARRSPARGPQ